MAKDGKIYYTSGNTMGRGQMSILAHLQPSSGYRHEPLGLNRRIRARGKKYA
jgi:hypothetical protein